MPRFHFHTEDGFRVDDSGGQELPNLEAAKQAAIEVLVQAIHQEHQDFWSNECLRVVVSDDDNLTLFSLDLAVTRSPAAPSLAQARSPRPAK